MHNVVVKIDYIIYSKNNPPTNMKGKVFEVVNCPLFSSRLTILVDGKEFSIRKSAVKKTKSK